MLKTETRGRKKIKDRFIISDHLKDQIISIKMVSVLLTNKEQNIRADKPVPEKYRKHVEKLIMFLKDWVDEAKNINSKNHEQSKN